MSRERGSAGLLLLVTAGVGCAVALTIVHAAADMASAAARARTAAEASALAAVGTAPLAGGQGDPTEQAERVATANGAALVSCCGPRVPLEAETVTAVAPASALLRVLAPRVHGRARAGLRPPRERHLITGGGGQLLVPVTGRVSSGYGWRTHPITGLRRMHTGVDFAAPTGTPVLAADGGTVVFAGGRGGYGLTVIVDHGGGMTTLYAHLSTIAVRRGQAVGRGAVVGAVGSTGTSTGPHLHFEVRVHGVAQDPLTFL